MTPPTPPSAAARKQPTLEDEAAAWTLVLVILDELAMNHPEEPYIGRRINELRRILFPL